MFQTRVGVEIGKDLSDEPSITVVPLSFPTCLRTVSVRWQPAMAGRDGRALPKLEEGIFSSTFYRIYKVVGHHLQVATETKDSEAWEERKRGNKEKEPRPPFGI